MSNCGGNFGNNGNAGVFNVNVNNTRGNLNFNIGFRSALPSKNRRRRSTDRAQRGDKGACSRAARRKTETYGGSAIRRTGGDKQSRRQP